MLSKDSNGTLWEEWWLDGSGRTGKFIGGRTRSDAQTESAFPPDLIASTILGLEVTKPGMKEIVVSQPNVDLKNIKASIPTPQGTISINWKLKEHSYLSITVPEGMAAKIDINSLNRTRGIKVNGKNLDQNKLIDGFLILKHGPYEIKF
jgi:hypothetical protein